MNLIEAAAGTGKTWAITSLYLRLLLEHRLTVSSVLVVTYTRAATRELRVRIRKRLRQALNAFESGLVNDDPLLQAQFENCADHTLAVGYLRRALADFDEAAIFTIHGFCQRVLADGAFESAMPFESELLVDESEVLHEVVNDFWRKEIYPAGHLWVSWLQNRGVSAPDDLFDMLTNLTGKPYLNIEPLPKSVRQTPLEDALQETFENVVGLWGLERGTVATILETDPGLNRRSYPPRRVSEWIFQMDLLLAGDSFDFHQWSACKAFTRFQASILCSDTALRKGAKAPQHGFFDACDELAKRFKDLDRVYENQYATWRRNLFEYVTNELPRRKAERHQLSYDDLLVNLQIALSGPGGHAIAERLRCDYAAALLDEFQDTDPVQYEIFRTIYTGTEQPVFMVGDPKQAIYSFRGADIFAYLDAKSDATSKYTLDRNYRSVPGLVNAVNALFRQHQNSSAFLFDDIHFNPAVASANVSELREHNKDGTPLVIWPVLRQGSDKPVPKYHATDTCAEAVAAETARLLSMPAKLGDRPLVPSDIAILVRTHHEGRAVEEALRDVRVPTVRLAQESVYATEEAMELERILAAVAQPTKEPLVRAALLTDLLGCNADDISSQSQGGRPWDDRLEMFHRYHERWRKDGFMCMFRDLAATESIFQRLLGDIEGERRVTNLLHLAERIEAMFGRHHDIPEVLKWFSVVRDRPPLGDEESLLRLESDQDRVRIATLHASKGLQFPVVFLPFAWGGGLRAPRQDQIIFHSAGRTHQATVDFGSAKFEEHLSQACNEELAENLRLLYVGLTRAQSRCYIAWGAVNQAGTSALAWLLHRPLRDPSMDDSDALANHFASLTDDDLMAALGNLTTLAPGHIKITELPVVDTESLHLGATHSEKLMARDAQRRVTQAWQLTSFSALTTGHDTDLPDHDAGIVGAIPFDDESPTGIFSFPRGARAGTCLHQIFEEIDFVAAKGAVRQATVKRALEVYGFASHWVDVVEMMLEKVLRAPLNGSGSRYLSQIKRSSRVNEMAFYFPILNLRAVDLRQLLSEHNFGGSNITPAGIEQIDFKTVSGFMHGYIDLVFETDGRFYIADYKSNHLGNHLEDYRPEVLEAAMVRQQYTLQYLVYTLAVHRFLGHKVVGYDYDRHFGGVYYLFLRGMDPAHKGNGIYFDRPSRQLIEAADALLMEDR
jgi:exodeoxyribonuclease V beta subunit